MTTEQGKLTAVCNWTAIDVWFIMITAKNYCEKGYGYQKILPVPQDDSLFIHT